MYCRFVPKKSGASDVYVPSLCLSLRIETSGNNITIFFVFLNGEIDCWDINVITSIHD